MDRVTSIHGRDWNPQGMYVKQKLTNQLAWKMAVKQLCFVVIEACIGISEVEATDPNYCDTRLEVPSVDF